jgi:hypothetical protein
MEPEPEPETQYDINYVPDEMPELTKEQEDYLWNIRDKQYHPDIEVFVRTLIEDYGLKVQKAETIAKEEAEKKGMSMWRKDYKSMKRYKYKKPRFHKKSNKTRIKEYIDIYEYKLVPLDEVEKYKKDKWE